MNFESLFQRLGGGDLLPVEALENRREVGSSEISRSVEEKFSELTGSIKKLQVELLDLAERHFSTLAPGVSQMPGTEPVLFAQTLRGFVEMFERDVERFKEIAGYAADSPALAAALGVAVLPLEPAYRSKPILRVLEPEERVSETDLITEFVFASTLSVLHLTQFIETLIMWGSPSCRFVRFSEAVFSPVVRAVEMVDAGSANTASKLKQLLDKLRVLPLGYSGDRQHPREPSVKVIGSLKASFHIVSAVVSAMQVEKNVVAESGDPDPAFDGMDIVDYLVSRDVDFQSAYKIVAGLSEYAAQKGACLSTLKLAQFRQFSPVFGPDVLELFGSRAAQYFSGPPTGRRRLSNRAFCLRAPRDR